MPAGAVYEAKAKAKAKAKAVDPKARQAEAKKRYPKMLAKALRDSERIASEAKKSIVAGNADARRLKKEAARGNREAFKARMGKLKPDEVDTTARVLKTLLAGLRDAA